MGEGEKTVGNVQIVTYSPHNKNAHGEEFASQVSIPAKDTSGCLVVVLLFAHVPLRCGGKALDLPVLATIFHAIGLNVMYPSERKRVYVGWVMIAMSTCPDSV